MSETFTEAESALVALGYKATEASRMVNAASQDAPEAGSEELIRLALKAAVKGLTVVCFGKLVDKAHEIRIAGDHKGCDGDIQFSATLGKCQGAVHNLAVEPEAVFIIPLTLFHAGRLTIGNHKYLLVRVAAAP